MDPELQDIKQIWTISDNLTLDDILNNPKQKLFSEEEKQFMILNPEYNSKINQISIVKNQLYWESLGEELIIKGIALDSIFKDLFQKLKKTSEDDIKNQIYSKINKLNKIFSNINIGQINPENNFKDIVINLKQNFLYALNEISSKVDQKVLIKQNFKEESIYFKELKQFIINKFGLESILLYCIDGSYKKYKLNNASKPNHDIDGTLIFNKFDSENYLKFLQSSLIHDGLSFEPRYLTKDSYKAFILFGDLNYNEDTTIIKKINTYETNNEYNIKRTFMKGITNLALQRSITKKPDKMIKYYNQRGREAYLKKAKYFHNYLTKEGINIPIELKPKILPFENITDISSQAFKKITIQASFETSKLLNWFYHTHLKKL